MIYDAIGIDSSGYFIDLGMLWQMPHIMILLKSDEIVENRSLVIRFSWPLSNRITCVQLRQTHVANVEITFSVEWYM